MTKSQLNKVKLNTDYTFTPYTFTATAGQTVFSITPSTVNGIGGVLVEVNGISLPPTDVSVVGSNVTIPACELNDEVVIRVVTRFLAGSSATVAENVGFVQSGTGAVARTVDSKLKEWVSVKDFGAVGDGVADDTSAIQAVITSLSAAGGTLYFPAGNYKITAPLNWLPRVNLVGVGGHVGSRLVGTHAGNIFQYTNVDFCIVEKLAFDGSGCTAFRQTGTGGNYTQNVTWKDCHFYGQLASCIYGNLIFCKIYDSTFGYYGTVGASHRHIQSVASATNLTNNNIISRNRLYYAKGNPSISFDSGVDLEISGNNFEQNTALPLHLNGIYNAKVIGNFFEQNSVATEEIQINTGTHVIDSTPTIVSQNHFEPNASITNVVKINNSLTRLYFDNNTGNLTGKSITNDTTKVFSQFGNSFTGLTPQSVIYQQSGTFTLTDNSGAGLSLTGGVGNWVRNGNVVSFTVSFTYPVTANGSNASVGGLPFASIAPTPVNVLDNTGASISYATNSSTSLIPYTTGVLTPRTNAQMSGKLLYVAGSYLTS